MQTLMMPNNIQLTQSYEEKRDLLTEILYTRGGNVQVTRRSYVYDALARPNSRNTEYPQKEQQYTAAFGYNPRSELTNAQLDDTTYAYNYDNIGNRITAQEAAEEITYVANELNQYTQIDTNDEDFSPEYDANGNQTLVKTSTGIWRVTYNAENRAVRFERTDVSSIIECGYDYMGRRFEKKVTINGAVTSEGDITQSIQWSSEYHDAELGLSYYNYRYYNSSNGRWITVDPLLRYRKETGYGYVRNLSTIHTDYLGLFSQRQPQLSNPSAQQKGCSAAGLAEPDKKSKESCKSYVKSAMEAKKIVDILKVLAQNKCGVPPIVCKCCQDRCKGAGAWHFPNEIVMCTNGSQSRNNTTNYLGHELTHHLQECQKRSGGSCINSLKSEVEAYKTHIKGCKNIVSAAQASVLLGGQCKKEELTEEVIKEAIKYCES